MLKYNELKIGRQSRYRPIKNWSYPVLSYDTETLLNGDIFLLADSLGNYVWRPTLRNCLDFLFKRSHHSHLNFFYNLEFDIRGIIKFLYESEQKKLVTAGKAVINLPIGRKGSNQPVSYTIRYCKDRMYIVKGGKKTVAFYDLAQFYKPLGLDKAAQTYLGERKEEIKDYDFTLESIEKRKEEIIKYCLRDCVLTQRLGELVKKEFEKLGIYEKVYISPAFLTEKYFIRHCYVPKTLSLLNSRWKQAVEYAYNSYKGGWIEIQKRGHFEHLYRYDINSAYPWVMSNLIDPTKGTWTKSKTYLNGATYAFLKCRVHIDPSQPDPYFSPTVYLSPISYLLSLKGLNLRYYPTGEWETYLTKSEYHFIRDVLGKRGKGQVELIDGWFFFPTPFIPLPLKNRIDLLYQKKTELKEASKTDLKALIEYEKIKLLLNSFYGKFIQRVEIRSLDKDENIITGDPETGKKAKTGNLFNPIWAAIITSEVRLLIARVLLDKEQCCAATLTDGILTTKPLDIPLGNKLGEWSEKEGGETVIILPGAYGIKGIKSQSKIRAFAGIFKGDVSDNWFDYLTRHKAEESIKIIDRRPVSLMEALLHSQKFTTRDINRFVEFEREYNLKENRRSWLGKIRTCGDLLKEGIDSTPWHVEQLERLTYPKRTYYLGKPQVYSVIKEVMKKGGIKDTPAIRDFGAYIEIPLCCRRKAGLPFDEMADELGMSENELWEGLIAKRA